MTFDVYGDRRCPTCKSVKETTLSDCWYCTRRAPTTSEAAIAEAEMVTPTVDQKLEDLTATVDRAMLAPFLETVDKHLPALRRHPSFEHRAVTTDLGKAVELRDQAISTWSGMIEEIRQLRSKWAREREHRIELEGKVEDLERELKVAREQHSELLRAIPDD